MLNHAAEVVADEHGKGLAVVQVSQPLSDAQRSHIDTLLVHQFGRAHYLAEQVFAPRLLEEHAFAWGT